MSGKFQRKCWTCQAGEAVKRYSLKCLPGTYPSITSFPQCCGIRPLDNNVVVLCASWKPEGIVAIIQWSDAQTSVESC